MSHHTLLNTNGFICRSDSTNNQTVIEKQSAIFKRMFNESSFIQLATGAYALYAANAPQLIGILNNLMINFPNLMTGAFENTFMMNDDSMMFKGNEVK